MFCMNCGTKLPNEAKFCFKCGAKIEAIINSDETTASVKTESDNVVEKNISVDEYIELAEKEYQEFLNCKNSEADLIREEAVNHKTQAISFFKNAGAKGEFLLAKHYMEENTPAELNEAMKIFKRLGDKGDAEAFYYLGLCYDTGDNKKVEQAKIWLLKADEIGHADALKTLGGLYYKNYKKSHEKEDIRNAIKYYGICSKRKDVVAMLELAKIAKAEDGKEGLSIKQCEKICNDILTIDKGNVGATTLLTKIAKERQEEKERLEREERKREERRKKEAKERERKRIEAEKRYRSPEETKKRIEKVIINAMKGFFFDYVIELGKEGRKSTTLYLGDIDSSKLAGAKRTYIKPKAVKKEEVLFLYDNTLTGDGEEGFALTPYGLTSSKYKKCIPFHIIDEVTLEGGFLGKDIYITLTSGSKIEFSPVSKCETEIVEALNEIICDEKCINDSELLTSSINKDDEIRNDILFLSDVETDESEEVQENNKEIICSIVNNYRRFIDGSLYPYIEDENIQKVIQTYGAGMRLNKENVIYLSQNCDFAITAVGLASDITPNLIRFTDIKEILYSDNDNKISIENNNGDIEEFGYFYRGAAVVKMLKNLLCAINHKEYKDEIKDFDSNVTLADIIKEVVTHNSYKFEKWFYLTPNIPQKKIRNVLGSYAENTSLKDENFYLLYDRTLIGSARDGYVITDKGLISSEHQELIPLSTISSAYKNDDGNKIYVKLNDGSDCYFAYNRVLPSLTGDVVDIINTIIEIATKCGLFNSDSTVIKRDNIETKPPVADVLVSGGVKTAVNEENEYEDIDWENMDFVEGDQGSGYSSTIETTLKEDNNANELFDTGKDYYDQKQYSEAIKCFKASAEQGNADAQDMLGIIYSNLNNDKVVTVDNNEALRWFKKAAEQNHLLGILHLGHMKEFGGGCQVDYKEALSLYERAANGGCVEAQAYLGWVYLKGSCGLAQDKNKALIWYRKAAEQGDGNSQFFLGSLLLNANPPSTEEAFKWYTTAADNGNANAQTAVGLFYEKGNIVAQSFETAALWYQKAIKQEQQMAYYHLGLLYRDGKGVNKDIVKAKQLLKKAAELGNKEAENDLQKLTELEGENKSDDGCFITTAVCDSLNKPDDCDELMTIRWLRDRLRNEDTDMGALIEEYYRVAPLIVKKINSASDAPLIYRRLWDNSISKIYKDIKQKAYHEAKLRYISMLEDLCLRYNEPLTPSVKERIERVRVRKIYNR